MGLNMNLPRELSRRSSDVGSARIEPQGPVVAGAFGSWRLTYVVGPNGIARGGIIRIDTESDTDWGRPQVDSPSAPDYLTVTPPPGANIATRIVDHQVIHVVVTGRALKPGEEIVVTLGDRAGGSPGSRAQTFCEAPRYFWVDVDTKGVGAFTPVAGTTSLEVIGGKPVRFIVVAPSYVLLGQPFHVVIKAEDEWGNPSASYRGRIEIDAPKLRCPVQNIAFSEADGGACTIDGFVASEAGTYRITVRNSDSSLASRSNPFVAAAEFPKGRIFWGDLHGGQVADPNKIGEFFRYAKDVAALNFAGFQRNDFNLPDESYRIQQKFEREYQYPERFVAIPGFEWSGEAAAGGHHNVYFRRFDQPARRSGHGPMLEKTGLETDLPHVLDLHKAYRHQDVVLTLHVGGVPTDLNYYDSDLERAVEVVSTHGTFEWFLREALERRYKVGFTGSSDSYTGRPGDDRPGYQLRRYSKSGLTAVFAPELTIGSVLNAVKARHCYATTGPRMLATVEADGHEMGSEYLAPTPPKIKVDVAGTASLEKVEIYRGLDLVYSHDMKLKKARRKIRVLWDGASTKASFSGIIWDGKVSVSGTRLTGFEAVRFESPRSFASAEPDGAIRWQSVACGYPSGLVLELDEPENAKIDLEISNSAMSGARFGGHGDSAPLKMATSALDQVKLTVNVSDLKQQPYVMNLGVLNRRVTIELAPEVGSEEVSFSFEDKNVKPGINPYWVKVTQTDMEMAWTSPVFVDYAPNVES